MSGGKTLVVTTYGHDDVIDKIVINTFENSSGYYSGKNNAGTYCETLNALELTGNSWVYAKIVSENTPFSLNTLMPAKFQEMILALENRAIQKVFREVDLRELAIALKGCNEAVLEKAFKNMSKRAAQMMKEDTEYMGPVQKREIMENQEKIMAIIRRLEDSGEIVIASCS